MENLGFYGIVKKFLKDKKIQYRKLANSDIVAIYNSDIKLSELVRLHQISQQFFKDVVVRFDKDVVLIEFVKSEF